MILHFEISEDDYSKSAIELYKKNYWRVIPLFLLISFVITIACTGGTEKEPTDWMKSGVFFIITLLLLNLTYFARDYYYFKKNNTLIQKNPLYLGKKTILVENDGFTYGIENNKYSWESVKIITDLPNYIHLHLHNNTFILINKKGLTNSEINNFIGKFSKEISTTIQKNKKKNSKNIYWLGLAGFIPNVGLITGVILLFLGFKRKDHLLKLIGLASILFTPLFWYTLTHSVTFDEAKIELTTHSLNEVVKDLEYYKSKNGFYPESLDDLRKQDVFFHDTEVFSTESYEDAKPVRFYYKKRNDTYILKSCGPDLKPNTKDDIYPKL